MADDANGNSSVVSDQEKGSRNKRKFEFPLEIPTDSPALSLTEFSRYELLEEVLNDNTLIEFEPLTDRRPQYNEEPLESLTDADWEDSISWELLELLHQDLFTIFQSAVKRISESGYSEETAVRVILRSGLYHGNKDAVSTIVDGALALLSSGKGLDTGRHLVFADLRSLVDYTLLEMIGVLRAVKPVLTVAEAMWWLLMLDLNLVHACTVGSDLLDELCNQESPGNSSSALELSQSKTGASGNTQLNPDNQQLSKNSTEIAQTLQSKVPVASAAPEESKSKNLHVQPAAKGKGSSVPLPEAEAKLKAAVLEDNSGAGRKVLNSRKDLFGRRNQYERNCRCRTKKIKANITALGSMVLDKTVNSSASSGATKKGSHSKVNTLVKSNKALAKASSDSPCSSSSIAPSTDTSSLPPAEDNINKKDPDSSAMEPKSSIKAHSTIISSAVPDYCTGIPYDESLGKYVPQDGRDEDILVLVPRLKTLQKELQGWSDWANEKVMQATRRLGKNQAELKMLRQEKKDVEKVHKEKQILEENTMKRLMEMEQVLVNTNYQIETANSDVSRLGEESVVLKKEMETLKLCAKISAISMDNALAKEQETVKKCQAAEVEKHLLQEQLSTLKQESADSQPQQEKAKKRLDQFEVLRKQEEKVKQRFLQQAASLKAKREQLVAQGKLEEDNLREPAKRNLQNCKEDIQKLESEISQLRLQSERSEIEALKRGTPQMRKGLAAYEGSSGSAVLKMERECVMCMSEPKSVLFLPCSHQVLCADCSMRLQKKGMVECPSCRTPIKQRIHVRFPDS
ncbi:putative E3 ubiquitin-protein ligase [Capsicum galapagoense]